jgi:hypothetical protein
MLSHLSVSGRVANWDAKVTPNTYMAVGSNLGGGGAGGLKIHHFSLNPEGGRGAGGYKPKF